MRAGSDQSTAERAIDSARQVWTDPLAALEATSRTCDVLDDDSVPVREWLPVLAEAAGAQRVA